MNKAPVEKYLKFNEAGTKIDEAFIGLCMTNISHFRAAAKLLGDSRDIPVNIGSASTQ